MTYDTLPDSDSAALTETYPIEVSIVMPCLN